MQDITAIVTPRIPYIKPWCCDELNRSRKNVPATTPGIPPTSNFPRIRKSTCFRHRYCGAISSFTQAAYTSDVVTASNGGTPRNSISAGAVITPPPTPVIPMATAIANPSKTSISPLLTSDVDPALEFVPAPTSRPQIVRARRRRGAGLAADTRVAAVVQRQHRNVVFLQIRPDLAVRP